MKKVPLFILCSALYVTLFLLVMGLRRNWVLPEKEMTSNECFTRFFIAGLSALIIYHAVTTFNLAE
jgi:hypothetical protein